MISLSVGNPFFDNFLEHDTSQLNTLCRRKFDVTEYLNKVYYILRECTSNISSTSILQNVGRYTSWPSYLYLFYEHYKELPPHQVYKHPYKHPHKHFISDNSRRDSEHKTRADYITILSASAGAAILLVSIIFLLAAVRYYLKIQG